MDKYRVNWNFPTNIWVGPGRISDLAKACSELNMQHPLLVTDPDIAGMPLLQRALEPCKEYGLEIEIFSSIKGILTVRILIVASSCYEIKIAMV